MDTTVKLQDPFSYALWPVIIAGIIVFGALLCYFAVPYIRKLKNRPKPEKPQPAFTVPDYITRQVIKQKYIAELYKIGRELNDGKINVRTAYQKMSSCIRHFVYEVSGIKVQNYTLNEINMLGIPVLSQLIAEYYASEFAAHSYGNVGQSIERARQVIERWN